MWNCWKKIMFQQIYKRFLILLTLRFWSREKNLWFHLGMLQSVITDDLCDAPWCCEMNHNKAQQDFSLLKILLRISLIFSRWTFRNNFLFPERISKNEINWEILSRPVWKHKIERKTIVSKNEIFSGLEMEWNVKYPLDDTENPSQSNTWLDRTYLILSVIGMYST